MQRKYLLRKIGKHICHAVLTIGIISGASSVVSADEVKEQDQTPKVEAVQKEVPKATDEASQKKSTSIDELTKPDPTETATIHMTAQIERDNDDIDVTSVQIGNTVDTTEVVKKQNVEAELDGMIDQIAHEANNSELKEGDQTYRIDRVLVNTERREVDGKPVYTYSVNMHAEKTPDRPTEPVIQSTVLVKDNKGATLVNEVKTGTKDEPVEFEKDWDSYPAGEIVNINDKAYRVEESKQRYEDVRDADARVGAAKTYLEVRVRELLKTTTETVSFKFVDTNGSIVRDKIDTEVSAGKAESIFNLGDTIVENGKTYNVVDRALNITSKDIPEGTHQDALYTITLKEVEKPKVEEVETFKTRVTVMDENGKVIVGEYDPTKEPSMPATDAYEADKSVTINGQQYVVKRVTLEINTSHEIDKDITTERYNVTVKAVVPDFVENFIYNANAKYEFNGKVIKVSAVGTKFATSREDANRGLESMTTKMQATVGQTIEINGVQYKIAKVKHIERESFSEDNGMNRLNAKVFFELEEVSQPAALEVKPSNEQDDESNQEKPQEQPQESNKEESNKEEQPEVKPEAKPQEEPNKDESNKEESNKEEAKSEVKPEEKPEVKPEVKEEQKQQAPVAKETSQPKRLPETGIAGGLELLGLGAVFSALGAASYLKKKK